MAEKGRCQDGIYDNNSILTWSIDQQSLKCVTIQPYLEEKKGTKLHTFSLRFRACESHPTKAVGGEGHTGCGPTTPGNISYWNTQNHVHWGQVRELPEMTLWSLFSFTYNLHFH